MRTPSSQRGMSLLSWIAILVVVGFFGLFGVKTVPAYFNYMTLTSVAQGVQGDPSLQQAPLPEIRSQVNTRMRVNDVDDVGDVGYRAIEIVQNTQGGISVIVDYEVREPFIGNIDLVMTFYRRFGP